MRRGYVLKPVGENVTVVKGRGGKLQYSGVDKDENGDLIFEKISMDVVIDSLNATPTLRARNRRVKIIFTQQQFVDGIEKQFVDDVNRVN